jgi:hypothetical protein
VFSPAGFAGAATPAGPLAQERDPIAAARDAVSTTDYLGAIQILTAEIESNPSPDAYLYLGLAHANLRQYPRALELFERASRLYPGDSRFLAETAGVHIADRNTSAAVDALERALEVDPSDAYASDLLASIRLSEGDVQGALEVWNAVDQPRIDDIFQNFSPGFLDRAVPRALTFGAGELVEYGGWKTSQARLFGSRLYSNVGLEIEPSPVPDLYNAIVRTTPRTNSPRSVLANLFRGLPVQTTHVDFDNIAGSGIGWRSDYRWDANRRRLRGRLVVPLPVPGLPVVELYDTWRFERWNVAPQLRAFADSGAGGGDVFGPNPDFDYKVNIIGATLHAIPHYRLELGGGFEYRNRDAAGVLPGLALDERDTATFRVDVAVRPMDGRFKSRILAAGFIARQSVLGDFDFNGGTLQAANRLELDPGGRTTLDFSVTGGTARGNPPVDHYFILGLGSVADFKLRAHVASEDGHYGKAPIGTDFVLGNAELRHRLMTVPLFDTLGLPYIEVHAMGFYDAARVFDRKRVFRQDQWLHDLGAGLRFETATSSFTVLYGRDTAGGDNAYYGYVEGRFW